MSRHQMSLDEYQKKSREFATYPDVGKNLVYATLGLTGEAGEFADKVKKLVRDHGGEWNQEQRVALQKELGDVLWYLACCCEELNLSLEATASLNLDKLASRKRRGVLHGSGDER